MKVSYLDTIIESICLHKVGNKIADEGVKLSKKHLIVQDNSKFPILGCHLLDGCLLAPV